MATHDDVEISRWVDERLDVLAPNPAWQPDETKGWRRFADHRAIGGRRGHTWALVAASVAVACLCLLALPPTRLFAERCVTACVGQATRVGQLLGISLSNPKRVAVADPDPREVAPDFTLLDASGKPVTLSGFHGKVVLLNFWATWCAPCAAEIPWFIEFQHTYRDQGLVVLGISLDDDGWTSVRPYVNEQKVEYPIMIGDADITRLYGGLGALPTTFVIDRSGRIASTYVGLVQKSAYEANIQAVLAEK